MLQKIQKPFGMKKVLSKQWNESAIAPTPHYKNGNTGNCTNYRGM
jgi:hypothetical protein